MAQGSRKLYRALAQAIADGASSPLEAGHFASIIAPVLAYHNSNFDEARFIAACVDGEECAVAHDPQRVTEVS